MDSCILSVFLQLIRIECLRLSFASKLSGLSVPAMINVSAGCVPGVETCWEDIISPPGPLACSILQSGYIRIKQMWGFSCLYLDHMPGFISLPGLDLALMSSNLTGRLCWQMQPCFKILEMPTDLALVPHTEFIPMQDQVLFQVPHQIKKRVIILICMQLCPANFLFGAQYLCVCVGGSPLILMVAFCSSKYGRS